MPLSPMMQHYLKMKEEYPDTIMFYRLGDFYEMFFDDAKKVSRELELTLTGRDCGLEERAPMCGVPFHAADVYIKRLIDKGYKVAICEQVEDPREAKGMVKREVIRVVTPGTVTDQSNLPAERNNYIMSVVKISDVFGVAVADISTGQSYVTKIDDPGRLSDEIYKFSPAELLCNNACLLGDLNETDLKEHLNLSLTVLPDWYYDDAKCENVLKEQFMTDSLQGLGITDHPVQVTAAGALFTYLFETQKSRISQIGSIKPYAADAYMLLDSFTRRNLELCETMREKTKVGSLLWVLDKTGTAMGARKLRFFIEQPLTDIRLINERLDAISELIEHPMERDELREYLSAVYDLERLMSRIANRSANPRDLISFKTSLSMLPFIEQLLSDLKSAGIKALKKELDTCTDICDLIGASIVDDPPVTIREGSIIKDGFDEQVDHYRDISNNAKNWLLKIEEDERERTGIKTLRIKYSRVFGYCIEVTNSFKDKVPEDYIRKQTLTNAERYTTPKLKELEDEILGAQDRLATLEYDIFCDIIDQIRSQTARIQSTASAIAVLDAYCSLAYVAMKNRYTRPKFNRKGYIEIKEGRHPVVEKMIKNDMFIPNDTYLDRKEHMISIVTGPNMAGKSTYMRQNALIVLMAQMGSYVPAQSADIGIVDRIFTRVGASDDLASGQSTFMVEMTEVANILRNATSRSLLILDEIGRGTSTFDGLSIAWAVTEHIAENIGARTLFATHYHELTELEGKVRGVMNYCIAVKEKGDDIIFLRKIIKGGADKSYGIAVAKLAGVPDKVLSRAKEIVDQLINADITVAVKNIAGHEKSAPKDNYVQLSLFEPEEKPAKKDIAEELLKLDVQTLTPIEALNELYKLQQLAREKPE